MAMDLDESINDMGASEGALFRAYVNKILSLEKDRDAQRDRTQSAKDLHAESVRGNEIGFATHEQLLDERKKIEMSIIGVGQVLKDQKGELEDQPVVKDTIAVYSNVDWDTVVSTATRASIEEEKTVDPDGGLLDWVMIDGMKKAVRVELDRVAPERRHKIDQLQLQWQLQVLQQLQLLQVQQDDGAPNE
ncbi:hypothetical protein PFISCL1PPCAC_21256, partial [Pristionchus fissidentatus]